MAALQRHEDDSEKWRRALEAAFQAAADRLNARIATCHERVSCPRCGAPVGKRCRQMPRGYRPLDLDEPSFMTKNPHKQRIAAAGIALR